MSLAVREKVPVLVVAVYGQCCALGFWLQGKLGFPPSPPPPFPFFFLVRKVFAIFIACMGKGVLAL